MVQNSLSYTQLVLKKRPVKKPGRRTVPKPRPLPAALQPNYDLFDLNKRLTPQLSKSAVKQAKKSLAANFERQEPIYIGQMVYIRPSYVVSLPEYMAMAGGRSAAAIKNEVNLKDNAHKGMLSRKAVGKMKNAINWLLCSAKDKMVYSKERDAWFTFKINFVTLTLPDTARPVTDEQFKGALVQPFLSYMRKFYNLGNYVWKLEFQKNGKLHLHLATETFIHWRNIRKCWNTILGHNNLLVDFYNEFGHADPNSTDVHSVRKIKNLAGYLAKYMSKQDADLSKVKGRIWGCSEDLSKANRTAVFIDRNACHSQMRTLMNPLIEYKPIMGKSKVTNLPRKIGEVFFLSYNNWRLHMRGSLKETFSDTVSFLQNTSGDSRLIFEV